MENQKGQPDDRKLRPTPLEEALARESIKQQNLDRERIELQNAANRALIRLAEKLAPASEQAKQEETLLERARSLKNEKRLKIPQIKQEIVAALRDQLPALRSRHPEIKSDEDLIEHEWNNIRRGLYEKK